MYSQFIQYNDLNLKEMFDIIIVLTGKKRKEKDADVDEQIAHLEEWKPMIEGINCIIIYVGELQESKELSLPSWMRYELYTKKEVERDFGKENSWMFGFPSSDSSSDTRQGKDDEGELSAAVNYGLLVSDRDFVFILHPSIKPIFSTSPFSSPLDLLRKHAMNLLKPSFPLYYHNHEDPVQQVKDNKKKKSQTEKGKKDFQFGVPYSLRDGWLTGISYGTIDNDDNDEKENDTEGEPTEERVTLDDDHYDTITKIMKSSFSYHSDHYHYLDNFISKKQQERKQQEETPDKRQKRKLRKSSSATVDKAEEKGVKSSEEKESRRKQVEAITIPKGIMFSLSLKNVAINRKLVGSLFCLLSGLEMKKSSSVLSFGSHYYAIFQGWMLKKVLDHIGIGIKQFDSSSYLQTRRKRSLTSSTEENKLQKVDSSASTSTSTVDNNKLNKKLKDDLLWLQKNEEVLRTIMKVGLSYNGKKGFEKEKNLEETVTSLKEIFQDSSSLQDFHSNLHSLVKSFSDWFYQRNDFHTRINPVSYSSSYFPVSSRLSSVPVSSASATTVSASSAVSSSASSTLSPSHECAAFTIVRNDSLMLDIWLRYASRHFGKGDIYVINHFSNEDEYYSEVHQQEEMKKLQQKYTFHLTNVFDNAGFPMGFFVDTADLFQRRLLRYGYKCILLSDADEIIVADPKVYPDGLRELLRKWVKETPTVTNYRARGYMIAHIYETEQGHDVSDSMVEKDIDWSKSLLSQRSYWTPQPHYNKPVLSKVPIREKPGFHNLYVPQKVPVENDLYLLHLRELDYNSCMKREERKFALIKEGHQSEIDRLYNGHLIHYEKRKVKGEVCQFAKSVYLKKNQKAYDNTGKTGLEKMDDKWKNVIV
jgi:hypothetical protein